jgi:hypothetical protein
LGELVEYTISATGADDIAAGISFARENNIRLVIKNTGIEYVLFCFYPFSRSSFTAFQQQRMRDSCQERC